MVRVTRADKIYGFETIQLFGAPYAGCGHGNGRRFAAQALNPDYYSSSSLLSSGKWARVITEGNGMRLISTATLRKLGFEDPSRVRVYGFGGRMLPEILSESIPDDLPPVPSGGHTEGSGVLCRGPQHMADCRVQETADVRTDMK